jgi:hypothetical protein
LSFSAAAQALGLTPSAVMPFWTARFQRAS